MRISKTPVMVSLHATKVLGIGEGAILLSKNEDLITRVESLTQFGFPKGIRSAESYGTNAKLSEYSGAIALAALDNWEATRLSWQKICCHYLTALNKSHIPHTLTSQWVPSTCNLIVANMSTVIAARLNKIGIGVRKWYGDGCHRQSVFKKFKTTALNNTDYLCSSVLGLPFFMAMETENIDYIVNQLNEIIADEDYR
jgi:dTDP-4-amino-4,6-dideoxygalactose transaminase